ncbi:MAG: metal ABC transporter substrate-binding protein [Cyanobacteriota bacterium]|nr:metal ABC transporter substrate-binding protein [Cyanobacteriota bacterium]
MRIGGMERRDRRIFLLGVLTVLGLGACRAPSADNAEAKAQVLTTFTVLADMAQTVAGESLTVQSLVKPGAEIHSYEPTPQDLERGQSAQLILDNGLNLERWAERFYQNLPQAPRVTLSQGVQPLPIASDAYAGKPNPHAWMSPQNALIYVDNIRRALSQLDPANAKTYEKNAGVYQNQIRALDQRLRQAIAQIPPEKRYLVSCEGAFSYLARDYGLQEIYLWPVNAERQASPQQTARVIEAVRAKQIPAVFCESTVNDQTQRQVARESGARYGGVFYVDSLSPPDGPAPTYLQLLEHNVNTLIQGLAP